MDWANWAKLIGGGAAAPFTGGATIPIALAGLGGVIADKSKQTATQSTTPTVAPQYGPLQSRLLDIVKNRLSQPADLSGYTSSGVNNINRAYGLTAQNTNNSLTARGLAGSPVAGVVDATRNNARAGDIASFENSVPLLADQLTRENLQQGAGLLSMGRGSTSTGTQEQSAGGGWGGAITNVAGMIGYLQGKGAFAKVPGSSFKGGLGTTDTGDYANPLMY